ncbi:hypothetical protein [Laspinema palackyanum]
MRRVSENATVPEQFIILLDPGEGQMETPSVAIAHLFLLGVSSHF